MPEGFGLKKGGVSAPLLVGALMLFVLLLILGGVYLESLGRRAYRASTVANSLQLNQRAAYGLMIDMETGLRGYIITGDDLFLEPYAQADSSLPSLWTELEEQAAELDSMSDAGSTSGATASASMAQLALQMKRDATSWRREWADPQRALRAAGKLDDALDPGSNLRGKQMFDTFRASSNRLSAAADERVRAYGNRLNDVRTVELWLLIGVGLLALSTAALTIWVMRRESRLQVETAHKIESDRALLQAVVDNLPVAVRLVAMPEGTVVMQNQLAEALFPAQVWNSIAHHERPTRFNLYGADGHPLEADEMIVPLIGRQGEPVNAYDLVMRDPSGGPSRHLLADAVPVRNDRGEITSAVVVIQDVTRMRELDERKDEFIATAAHELRNPLSALWGYNQLAQRMLSKGEESVNHAMLERHLAEMGRQASRLNTLVERLLDASRIQLGRLILEKGRADLARIARVVAGDLSATGETGHEVTVRGPLELWGEWDATRLEQVLSNLVSNAVRHTPPGEQVEVRISEEDDSTTARVEVADRGPGISDEEREHIFQRYYQSPKVAGSGGPGMNSSRNDGSGAANHADTVPLDVRERLRQGAQLLRDGGPKKDGLGLGLYISSEIVKAHGGAIGVEDNPGGGSIFWFTLPLG